MTVVKRIGRIVSYNPEKFFGFIRFSDEKFAHIFFHASQCLTEPKVGLSVQFSVGVGRGGPAAQNISEVGDITAGAIQSLSGSGEVQS